MDVLEIKHTSRLGPESAGRHLLRDLLHRHVGQLTPVKNRLVIERVVFEFYAPLYRFALALANSETEAADLTQETFLILCKRRGQVREPDKIKSWLFTTLRRTFLQTLRRRHSRPEDRQE